MFAKLKPKLILLCGLPGAGKTFYAKRVERETGAVRYTIDEEIVAKYGNDFPENKFYLYAKGFKKGHEVAAKRYLKSGESVILDYGFWDKKERQYYKNLAKKIGVETEIVYFKIPFEILVSRLEKRNVDINSLEVRVTREMLEMFAARFEEPSGEGEIVIENQNS